MLVVVADAVTDDELPANAATLPSKFAASDESVCTGNVVVVSMAALLPAAIVNAGAMVPVAGGGAASGAVANGDAAIGAVAVVVAVECVTVAATAVVCAFEVLV